MRLPRSVSAFCLLAVAPLLANDLKPVVEVEEDVYSYVGANNGSGPMWCGGSTCLVRAGKRVFVTGIETIPNAKPLNNCRWVLLERTGDEWKRMFVDEGRTREPSPMAVFHTGQVIVSGNPTLTGPDAYNGASRPELWEFGPEGNNATRTHPHWSGTPSFSEHSYRTLAADGERGELVLMQNIGYGHAEWTFRNSEGEWSAQGQLRWPQGAEYRPPKPIRLCYPNVGLSDRAVHFFGVGDITEPVKSWRQHKARLTGRKWDYVFRRLYYTWTPDITDKPFRSWIEIANREETAGHIRANDLRIGSDGLVHLLWTERALDERLHKEFFPKAKQSHALNYAVLKEGKVLLRKTLLQSTEDNPGLIVSLARFHLTPDDRLFAVMYMSGTEGRQSVAENRIAAINPNGTLGAMHRLPLKHPISNFFTATPRAGSARSELVDLLGPRSGKVNTLSYVRVKLN